MSKKRVDKMSLNRQRFGALDDKVSGAWTLLRTLDHRADAVDKSYAQSQRNLAIALAGDNVSRVVGRLK